MDRRKLDRLTELASEIGSVEGALDHLAEALREHGGDPALAREAQRARSVLRRRVRELHEGLLDARMAPLDEPFARVAGVVRELAIERDKRVRLLTRGGDTRIDRALAEPVGEALTALVRHAIDREIDTPATRERAGRAADATLEITARAHASRLRIAVRHDGRPVAAGEARDDVALERVRETLARVGGTLARQQDASGTTTVTLEVPVSVVRIPALLFEAGGCVFAIGRDAASAVRAFVPADVEWVDDREVLRDQDGTATLYRLADVLGLRPSAAGERGESHAFMLDGPEARWALAVDRLIGREELLVTAFGPSLRGVPALVGAADLGDERIALVVDARAPIDRVGDALRAREPVGVRGVSETPPSAMTPSTTDAVLVVEIIAGRYALPLSIVREVVAAARVTRVPRAPAGVAGVISRHGAIRTVLDLAWLVGRDAPAPPENSPMVLVDLGDESVGLRVERVVRVAHETSGDAPAHVLIDPAKLFAMRTGKQG